MGEEKWDLQRRIEIVEDEEKRLKGRRDEMRVKMAEREMEIYAKAIND